MIANLARITALHNLALMSKTKVVGKPVEDIAKTPIIISVLKDETAYNQGGGNPSNSAPSSKRYVSDF